MVASNAHDIHSRRAFETGITGLTLLAPLAIMASCSLKAGRARDAGQCWSYPKRSKDASDLKTESDTTGQSLALASVDGG